MLVSFYHLLHYECAATTFFGHHFAVQSPPFGIWVYPNPGGVARGDKERQSHDMLRFDDVCLMLDSDIDIGRGGMVVLASPAQRCKHTRIHRHYPDVKSVKRGSCCVPLLCSRCVL